MAPSWCARLAVALTLNSFFTSGLAQSPLPSFTTVDNSTPMIVRQSAVPNPTTWIVKAGAGGFKFTPQSLSNVSIGDIVSFEFYPPDHSVARAEFGSACVPYESTGPGRTGFWSGTQLVDSVAQITYFNITVNSTEPIFFYCAASKSCTKELMVGAINPNSTQTLEMQIGYAKSADYQLAPGEAAPREGVASSTPSSISESSGGKRISTGLMIGIAVGVVAFLAMCAALFFFIGRSRSLKESVKKHNERSMMKPIGVGGGGYHDLSMQHQNTHPQSQVTGGPYSPTPAQAEFGTPLPAYNQLHGGFGAPADHKYAHHTGISGHGQQYYNDQKSAQPVIAELQSPLPGQHFAAELEAPQRPIQAAKR